MSVPVLAALHVMKHLVLIIFSCPNLKRGES